MQIELYIDGEKKIFTVPYAPQLAKRKYLEIMVKAEEREGIPTAKEQLEEEDALYSILADVVFKSQFTINELYEGASHKYNETKLAEAVFGVEPKGNSEGNEQGK